MSVGRREYWPERFESSGRPDEDRPVSHWKRWFSQRFQTARFSKWGAVRVAREFRVSCDDRTIPFMPRNQPKLHEAMRTILLDHRDRSATLQELSRENAQRDLYRKEKGGGSHPPAHQFRSRARHPKYRSLLDFLPPNVIRYIGP